ncbi:putative phage abortive infection protein [Sulfurovum sp. XGS-02]|uniref:putative phage abortive infection protein n=1 Tax=Sulfurovum sp. XGS-02 TaxID=2925411 RepID=UPI0020682F12|nr:putative phage abortive infection protein [Sulfurovum sp. XGS-02]UPT76680.1 putative phage abortive infection protein [Sulfurovum sp. XGS-02]
MTLNSDFIKISFGDEMENSKDKEYNIGSYWKVFLLIFISWFVFMAVMFWSANDFEFDFPPSTPLSFLGLFGDSFNVLTSLFTGLAFAGVIISVELQRKELKSTRDELTGQKDALEKQKLEMEQQSFDNRFFQMLNRFNKIREKFVADEKIVPNGSSRKQNHILDFFNGFCTTVSGSQNIETVAAMFKDSLFLDDENEFKYYFINLYQILKFIDKFYNERIDEAKFHTNMIRAQLTSNESQLLFLHIFFLQEFGGKKYMELIKKYAMLEHLDYERLKNRCNDPVYKKLIDHILLEYEQEVFGKNKKILEHINVLKKL